MSKHNYSQYSNNKRNNYKPVDPEVTVSYKEEPVIAEPVAETVIETPVEIKMEVAPVVEPKPITGVVANCVKLNVRDNPRADADVVCVLNVNSEMEIDMNKSTSEWFRISTAAGVDGYCMRKFVKVNP